MKQGQALSRHNDIDAIAFTGSTRTGKQLLKDAGDSNMKRVWLEAGGKSANLVFADCPDLQKAASATAAGIFYNQGQVCIAERVCCWKRASPMNSSPLKQQAQNWQPGHPLIRNHHGTLMTAPTPTRSIALFGKAKAKGNCCWMVVTLSSLPPSARPSLWM
ncbi:aldehyde dehydrogenase family protein [Escherichia coli]